MKKVMLLLLLSLCFTGVALALPLDGKTYKGTVLNTGEQPTPDNFEFTNGQFHSTACDEHGYTAAPYSASTEGKSVSFKATTKNKEGDTIAWHGTVNGEEVKGTALRQTAKGEKYNMSFEGKLVAGEHKSHG